MFISFPFFENVLRQRQMCNGICSCCFLNVWFILDDGNEKLYNDFLPKKFILSQHEMGKSISLTIAVYMYTAYNV